MKNHDKIVQIQDLFELGVAVLLLQHGSKIPLEPHSELPRRSIEEIGALLYSKSTSEYTPNLGILCGHRSNGLIVVDIDKPKVFKDQLPGLLEWLLSSTYCVQTRKGYHAYFFIDETINTTSGTLSLYGYEIRAEKSYVVAEGSEVHGHIYNRLTKFPPLKVSLEELQQKGLYLSPGNQTTDHSEIIPSQRSSQQFLSYPKDLLDEAMQLMRIVTSGLQPAFQGSIPVIKKNNRQIESRSEAEFVITRRLTDALIPKPVIADYLLYKLSNGTHLGDLKESEKEAYIKGMVEKTRQAPPNLTSVSEKAPFKMKQILKQMLIPLRKNEKVGNLPKLAAREQIVLESLIIVAISAATFRVALSLRDLSRIALASTTAIFTAINKLLRKGYISVAQSKTTHRTHATQYTLMIEKWPPYKDLSAMETEQYAFLPLPPALFLGNNPGIEAFLIWRCIIIEDLTTMSSVLEHFKDGLLNIHPNAVLRKIDLLDESGLLKVDNDRISTISADWGTLLTKNRVETYRAEMSQKHKEQSSRFKTGFIPLSKEHSNKRLPLTSSDDDIVNKAI